MRAIRLLPLCALLFAACGGDEALDARPGELEQHFECDETDDLVSEVERWVGVEAVVDWAAVSQLGGRIADDPARLPGLQAMHAHPRRASCLGANVVARADAALESALPVSAVLLGAAAELGVRVEVGSTLGAPSLATALARVGVEDEMPTLPEDLDLALGQLVVGAIEAASIRQRWLSELEGAADYFDGGADAWMSWGPVAAFDPGSSPRLHDPRRLDDVFRGAAVLAAAVDRSGIRNLPPPDLAIDLTIATPLGAVVVRGSGNDVHETPQGPVLLFVDLGGDDVYRIPTGSTLNAEHPVSLHVDLSGDDRYEYPGRDDGGDGLLPADAEGRASIVEGFGPYSLSRTGRQGSGRLGYGFSFDFGGGDDSYRSLRMSQGFGMLGVGLLWDDGGDDRYEAEIASQGAGIAGVGILFDADGRDAYRAFLMGQGFAGPGAFGALYDDGGDDVYEMVSRQPVLVGAHQTDGATNVSLGQGMALGWRDDATKNHLSGGLGLLRDRAGDDVYECGVFCQGSGYWMGVGVLADARGDDRYRATFYGQGTAAHFAAGLLLEGDGNDTYVAEVQSALGLGHDFALGVFVDDAGADVYSGPAWSLGASTCRGVGLFVDNGGDDSYEADDRSLGASDDLCMAWPSAPAVGLFADAGGRDGYSPLGRDDARWRQPPRDGLFGGGVDREGMPTSVRAYGAAYGRGE